MPRRVHLDQSRDYFTHDDGSIYQDKGCRHFESCLDCPLAECVYDNPAAASKLAHRERYQAIYRAVIEGGLTTEAAALQFRVTERTIFRALRVVKDGV